MKVLIAPDSFKGSITSIQAAKVISRAIHEADEHIQLAELPMADGGEGTVDAILLSKGGEKIACRAEDPLGRPITAHYGWIEKDKTAIIETAAASGLPLLKEEDLNPSLSSSCGTGQLISDALDKGAETIIFGLGGSATVDAGIGLFQALGLKIYDDDKRLLEKVGGNLGVIAGLDISQLDPRLMTIKIIIASDVTNPLLGKNGAIYIFGPQKGIAPDKLAGFERGMKQLSEIVHETTGKDMAGLPGSGAAGGIGFLFYSLLNAEFRGGLELMMEMTGFLEQLEKADLVITGEGKIDGQSLFGKVPVGIGRAAQEAGVPVIAFAGTVGEGLERLEEEGIYAVMPITDQPMPLAQAMERGEELLYKAAKRLMKLLLLKLD